MRRRVVASLVALLVLLLVVSPPAAASYQPQCRLDFTSLALLSCQETSPQSPTVSCCKLLLDAIDEYPTPVGRGLCCLCTYLVQKNPTFDLAAAYVSCRGKDAASVAAWMQQRPRPLRNCDGLCRTGLDHGDDAPPPPKPKTNIKKLSTAAIVVIVLSVITGTCLIGYVLYRCCRSAAAKEHRSPDPSIRDGGNVQMTSARNSSARFSTSRLLQQ